MTEGVKHGLIFIVMSAITIAFCLLFYPPITEKLKNIILLKEQKNYDNAKGYGDNRSENVVQVAGDVHNHYGLAVDQVEKLVKLFLKENFPVLLEEAMETARANVKQFLNSFENKMKLQFANIDLNKFKDPDIQSSLNDAVLESAKKGARSNTDILADLVLERLKAGTND